MNKIFVGWDSREDVAYQVAKYSAEHRSNNVEVIPLKQEELREQKLYTRDIDKLASTEFTFTRFLVPKLMNYDGWALFMDCDIIFLESPDKLFDQVDDRYAVMCAKHDYTPKPGLKMDGQQQTVYPRKNWSSVVLFNCGHKSNKKLTTKLVNDPETTGAYLHRFSWLKDEEIGEISHEWNWLAGWYTENDDGYPKAIHYTEGGPWFANYINCPLAEHWQDEHNRMINDLPK